MVNETLCDFYQRALPLPGLDLSKNPENIASRIDRGLLLLQFLQKMDRATGPIWIRTSQAFFLTLER